MNSYQVIRYQPEHRAAALELLVHLWGDKRQLNERTFRWKYEQNPYLQPPIIYIALYREVPVAMRGFLGTMWETGTDHPQTIVAPCAVDTVIHPDRRNKGLFRMIMDRAALDLSVMGYPFMLNLSASPIVHLSSLAMDWKSVGPLDDMIFERSSWRPRAEKKLKTLLKRAPGLLSLATNINARLSNPGPLVFAQDSPHVVDLDSSQRICAEDEPRPHAMARLARRVPLNRILRHVKHQEFFEWRFHNPRSRYRFFFLEQGEALRGYMVLQHSTVSFQRRINIVDWEALDEAAFRELLKVVIRIAGSKGLRLGGCVLSDESKQFLGHLRFVEMEHTQSLRTPRKSILVKPLENASEAKATGMIGQNLLNIQAWDMRKIFSDAV